MEKNQKRQPPCEAVSWNSCWILRRTIFTCQPPCEAVSWNIYHISGFSGFGSSASLWGCELKCRTGEKSLERLWSASLWGCELKWDYIFSCVFWQGQPPCEAVSWNWIQVMCWHAFLVSLLVRLWVEMSISFNLMSILLSASLWGCELKCKEEALESIDAGQPPCEAVSWNKNIMFEEGSERTSASLWGCELKYIRCRTKSIDCRQPPCEAVSWNSAGDLAGVEELSSASLWGCELKWYDGSKYTGTNGSASLWGCELKCLKKI